MPTVTKAANAHTVVSTGWTNPSNAYGTSADTVYATTLNNSTTKNLDHSGDFGFPDFTTSDIPDGAVITSVTLNGSGYISATGAGVLLGLAPYLSGSLAGTETTNTTSTTNTAISASYSTLPTLSDLRSASTTLKARARGAKGNTSTAFTVFLDFVSVTVTYSTVEEVTFTASATIGSNTVGAPTWVSPADGTSIGNLPTLVFTIPSGPSGNYHFHLQLDKVNTFNGANLREHKTNLDQTGWDYWNGSAWTAFPSGGVASTFAGNQARYTVQSPLSTGTWYRRIRGGK